MVTPKHWWDHRIDPVTFSPIYNPHNERMWELANEFDAEVCEPFRDPIGTIKFKSEEDAIKFRLMFEG